MDMKDAKVLLKIAKMVLRVGISTFTLWFYVMFVYINVDKSKHTLMILILSFLFTLLLQDWNFKKKKPKEDKVEDEV